jgi:hypothetical protein
MADQLRGYEVVFSPLGNSGGQQLVQIHGLHFVVVNSNKFGHIVISESIIVLGVVELNRL